MPCGFNPKKFWIFFVKNILKMTSTNKLKFTVDSYHVGVTEAARRAEVTRPAVYEWRRRLERSADLIFGHGGWRESYNRLEKANDLLKDRLAELELILGTHNISFPPTRYRSELAETPDRFEERLELAKEEQTPYSRKGGR